MNKMKQLTAALALIGGAGLAHASTLDVCSSCSYQTIADAIAAAATGDDIYPVRDLQRT